MRRSSTAASVLGTGLVLLLALAGAAGAADGPGGAGRPGGAGGRQSFGGGAAELPVPEQPSERARRVADSVLARPEFQPESETLLQRARRAAREALQRLLGEVLSRVGTGPAAWATLVLFVGGAGLLVWRFWRGVTPDPSRAAPPAAHRRRSAAEWRTEAEAHERAGDWRLALRCRYRALVAHLAGGGTLEEVPGRTAGEYRSDVARGRPAVAGEFAEATALFEDAWYGNRPTGPDENERFRTLADRVMAGAGR